MISSNNKGGEENIVTESAQNLSPIEPEILDGPDIDDFGPQLPDSIGLLMHDARRFPLLDASHEVELAQKIRSAYLATEELESLNGSANDTVRQQLLDKIQEGKEAKDLFISSNLRLVMSIAKRTGTNSGVDFEDRVSMGIEGLIRGVEKFDHTKGFKFSTYGTWWIKQSIQRNLANESRTIRLPVHSEEKVTRVNLATRQLERELNREPTDDEITEAVGFNAAEFMKLVKPALGRVSLNSLMGDGDDEFGDIIAKTDDTSATDEIDNESVRATIFEAMDTCLNGREIEILRLRFGLDGQEPKTLDEIGQILGGITRERVRQITTQATQKLARNQNVRVLAREAFGEIGQLRPDGRRKSS